MAELYFLSSLFVLPIYCQNSDLYSIGIEQLPIAQLLIWGKGVFHLTSSHVSVCICMAFIASK